MNQENNSEFSIHTIKDVDGDIYASGFCMRFNNGLEMSVQFGLGNYCTNKKCIDKEETPLGILVKSKNAEVIVYNDYKDYTMDIFGRDAVMYASPDGLIKIMQMIAEWRLEK